MKPRAIYYFDNNATTRVAPEVIEAMLPYLQDYWGNPSSIYHFGSQLAEAIDQAREQVAGLIHADSREVVFTSCGTESINAVLHSAVSGAPAKRHIVTTAVEHSATINCCDQLQKQGCEITWLPVDANGQLDPALVEAAIRPDTALVSVMLANNETGVVFPVAKISEICRAKGVLLHADAVQAPGKLQLDVRVLGVDFLSLSAHKLHAPKGVGLLFVRRHTKFQPYLVGGHQERDRRGGTENVAGIVGFGRAAELALSRLDEENTRVRGLRDRLENTILARIPATKRNGDAQERLPNTSNISFANVEGEAVLMMLDQLGVCASSGSACTTGSLEPSHVLTAMGLNRSESRASIRFSLGLYNTEQEVDYLLAHLPAVIEKLRSVVPRSKTPFVLPIQPNRLEVGATLRHVTTR